MVTRTRFRSGQRRSEDWFAAASLGDTADAYLRYLTERGYAAESIKGYFRSVAHFVHWCTRRGFAVKGIHESRIDQFLDGHLPRCRCAPRCYRTRAEVRAALRLFFKMLGVDGIFPRGMSAIPAAIAAELGEFDRHLVGARGLAASTRAARIRHLQDFLIDCFGAGSLTVKGLMPPDVVSFMTRYTAGWAPGSIKVAGTSLRSYFMFKSIRGERTKSLIAALPRVAQWRHSRLPQGLSADEIELLLGAFDRTSATGKRDYAITRCLLDLGLRRTEVAHLRLDDVDWEAGTLHFHAKGKRIDILPLPDTAGAAIMDYLRNGRPQTTRRELFVRHRPPSNAPADLDIIRNAVRYAAQRCGLERRIRGTHILRHTVACRMVQSGARFKEIADLLRHRSLDTTTIYAKVDLAGLSRVAMPWPGRQA
jgi:site-specific recombinase XerD